MRVLVLINNKSKNKKLDEYARALALGLQENGHTVDLEGTRFAMYDYICIGSDTENLWGTKIDPLFSKVIENYGSLSNQRCFAFVAKSFRSERKLLTLMRLMESFGMYIKNSDIISSTAQAKLIGKKLHVQ